MAKNEWSCDCMVIHPEAVERTGREMLSEACFERLSAFYRVFGDLTRTRILWALDRGELCVCDLANLLGMTKSAVSHQLGLLRDNDLVRFRREGKTVFYALADDHVRLVLEMGWEHISEEKGGEGDAAGE